MGNESSSMNGISREELIEIQKKQIKLEHQNRKIREQLEKTNKNNKTNKTTSIINSLDLETILKNPHIIFGLEPNAPLEEIKPIYKKLVLMFHPDKSGYDSKEHYSIIKKAYNTIVENRIRQEKNEGLANQTMETIRDDREELDRHLERHNYYFETSNGSNFNNSKFNQMFDTHKFVDETGANKGYSDWLKDDSNFTMSQPQVSSKDKFNSIFDEYIQKKSNNQELIQYIDPETNISTSAEFEYLGLDTSDFTKHGKYTDLKKAYSENNTIHPGVVKSRDNYTSIEQIKQSRNNVSLTKEEQDYLEMKQKIKEQEENLRQNRLRERDTNIDRYYTQLHGRTIELPSYKR